MFSCDYNGWADVPEEEREGIDAFEAGAPPSVAAKLGHPLVAATRQLPPARRHADAGLPQRKAA